MEVEIVEINALTFAEAVRRLNMIARAGGLVAPSFRSKPQGNGHRTIRRRADGSATVAVALRGRPAPAVLADLIDGIIAANELESPAVADLRDRLWAEVVPLLEQTAPQITDTGNVVALAA